MVSKVFELVYRILYFKMLKSFQRFSTELALHERRIRI